MEGNAPVSMLILLDNSYSMDVKHANGSRYEKAIEAAKKLIAATPKGSEISIIQSGGLPVPLFDRPVFDQAAVIRKLDRSTAGMGATMIEDSMNELQSKSIYLSEYFYSKQITVVYRILGRTHKWKDHIRFFAGMC